MKREFPESPLVGVGAIIIDPVVVDPVVVDPNKVDPDRTSGSRVVLVKRGHPPIQGQWSIPGGVLEVGEFVRDAALREAREETGLIVEPGELLGVFDRVLRHADGRVQYHYVLVDFLCRPVGGELCAASDAVEVRWFTREELPALNLAEDTLEVIEKAFKKIVSRG